MSPYLCYFVWKFSRDSTHCLIMQWEGQASAELWPLTKPSPKNGLWFWCSTAPVFDISAQGQLVKSGRQKNGWGVNIRQRWHSVRASACLLPSHVWPNERTWQARSQSRSTGPRSLERHSFLCILNYLTCNYYGSSPIFRLQDLCLSGILFCSMPSENSCRRCGTIKLQPSGAE